MPKLIAVIHYINDEIALDNAEIAFEAGFEGVCLIHMRGLDKLVEPSAVEIKRNHPDRLVITNRLTMHPVEMLRRDHELGLDGSWCDNPGATSAGPSPLCREINEELARVRLDNPEYLFFGSVAFKTHDPEPNPAQAAVVAMNLGWIATTSGTATGVAPPAEKLEDMKMAVAANDLAVASGITPDNAAELAPHVDWILVATGISETFYTFSPALCKSLRAATLD
jgi:hypothetical protein